MRHEVDMTLSRQFHIGLGEQRYFEFRADAFNLFNNVVFNIPDTNIGDYSTNAASNKFGVVTSQQNEQTNGGNGTRNLQVALKFYY
jgi:hypothetical protein